MLLRVPSLILVLTVLVVSTACREQSRDELMSQANKLVSEGNHKGAAVVYLNVLEKHPGDPDATRALAEAYLLTGKVSQAKSESEKLLAKTPEAPEAILLAAKVRLAERNPEAALSLLSKLTASPSAPSLAWELTGQARFFRKEYPDARDAFRMAIQADQENTQARSGMVECLLALGESETAQKELDALLLKAPTNKAGLYLQARLQTMRDEEDALIATYGTIARNHHHEVRAIYAEAYLRLTKKNDIAFARKQAHKLTELYKKSPEGYKLRGLVFLASGDALQAVDPLFKALRMRPDVDTELYLAQAFSALDKDETAINHLQSALTQQPDLLTARRMLATIFLKQKRLDEAIDEVGKIFKTNPRDEKGRAILADALVAKRDYDKGLAVFEDLSRAEGVNPSVFLKKGMILAMRGKDTEAEADLRKAVDMSNGSLENRLALSSFLASKKRFNEAVEALHGYGETGTEAALALNAVAKLRLRQGQVKLAMETLDKARQADPALLMTYFNMAAMSIAIGKPEDAMARLEDAVAVAPTDVRALLSAGAAREAKGQFKEAQALYERASATGSAQGSMALAEFYIRREDKQKALLILDELLSKSHDTIPAWLMKSRLHANLGEHDKARTALSRVETMNQAIGLRERAKYFLAVRDKDQALFAARQLRDVNTRSAEYAIPLAEIQELTGDTDAARTTLNKALKEDPKSFQAMIVLSNLEARNKHFKQSVELIDKAVLAGMNPATAHAMRGVVLQQAGETDLAAKDYEIALAHDERQFLALNNLAMILAERPGSAGESLNLAMRAYAMEPHNASVLDTLGYCLLKNGRVREARTAFEEADKLSPGNPDIKNHLEAALKAANPVQQ